VAIDRFGWDRFVDGSGMKLVDECPDPCNEPFSLRLYDVPRQVYETDIRVVTVVNASPERDGTRRRFGLTTPAEIDSALDAVAWTFEMSGKEYAKLGSAS
jgi:hypothetical protein